MLSVVREVGPTVASLILSLISIVVFFTRHDLWLALAFLGVALAFVGGSLLFRIRDEREEARQQTGLGR